MADTDVTREIRRILSDPAGLCERLGLTEGMRRQSGGVLIRCPVHRDKSPSCSVRVERDGTIWAHCFGCDFAGDAIDLVASVYDLDDFRETLKVAADLAGVSYLLDATRSDRPVLPPRRPVVASEAPPTRTYPPEPEIASLWGSCGRVAVDGVISGMLTSRAIDPVLVDCCRIAGALPVGPLPNWAKYRGSSWLQTGHRLVLPVYDAMGALRSVRAWRVTDHDSPKRLPPGGHKATGLVLANDDTLDLLRGDGGPTRLVVVEGEPDFLTWATRHQGPVVGLLSGAWTQAHADRIPFGSVVDLRTHCDTAGDKYAGQFVETMKGKGVTVRRLQP